jgi:hypothetical protein
VRRWTVVTIALVAVASWAALTSPGWAPTVFGTVNRAHVEEPPSPPLEGDVRPVLTGRSVPKEHAPALPRVAPAPPEKPPAHDGVRNVSLRVDAVDAHTGSTLAGRWIVDRFGGLPFDMIADREGLRAAHEMLVEKGMIAAGPFDEVLQHLERLKELRKSSLVRFGDTAPAAFSPEPAAKVPLDVELPTGYVSLAREHGLTFHRAVGIERTWALLPLVREAVLDVRILGPDGRPAAGAGVTAVEVGGEVRAVATEPRGPGEIRLRGIPFLPDEPVHLGLRWDPAAVPIAAPGRTVEEIVTETEETVEVVEEGLRRRDATTRVPHDLAEPWSLVVHLPGPLPGALRDAILVDHDMPYEESLGKASGRAPLRMAALRVRVLDREGRPVAGALVFGKPPDVHGEISLSALPGPLTVGFNAAGRLGATAQAQLVADHENEVVLREPQGTRLEVLVTDEEGIPRPCAQLTVSGRVFDVEDGVQRVDLFTDHRGRRSLARVEPGPRTVQAHWGSRHGSLEVDLADGETRRVTIVAK